MPSLWRILILLSVLALQSHAQEESPRTGDDDYDAEYYEPGRATEDCVCVPFYLCSDGEIVDDGSNIIDPRKKPAQDEELPLDDKYVPPGCGPYHVCCREPGTATVRPYEHRCGTRNPGGINGRILTAQGSGEAEFGEWPWQAAILRRDGEDYIFKCGGTLIDERHIITVAHCANKFLDDKASMVVRLGEWDTQTTNEFMKHEDFDVEEIMIHPQFNERNLFNDIAVVRLARDVVFKPHIDSACLPRDEDDFTGHECITTGWGTDAYKSGQFSLIMKEVTLPVLGHDTCQSMLRKTRLGQRFKLHPGFLCAGGKAGQDTCKGDGGGPLVCYRDDNSYTVAGLVAWGIDCGHEGVPGVYVNVKKYINWITSKTQKPLQDYWSSP